MHNDLSQHWLSPTPQLKYTLTQVYLTQRSRKYLLSRPDRTASPCAAPARCDPRARSPRSLLISARTESALKCTALSRRARIVASVVFPAPGNPITKSLRKMVSLYLIGDNSRVGFRIGKNPQQHCKFRHSLPAKSACAATPSVQGYGIQCEILLVNTTAHP